MGVVAGQLGRAQLGVHLPRCTRQDVAGLEQRLEIGAYGRPLAVALAASGPASQRLRTWLSALFEVKRVKALEDPELFATYRTLIAQTSDVAAAHLRELAGQLAAIIADGVAAGEFTVTSANGAAQAVLSATARFHDPCHAAAWADPGIEDEFQAVCDLLLRGLSR